MFATSQSRSENRAIAIILCLVGIFVLSVGVQAQTTSTWSGGAGNWDPCPPTGDALWSTCPNYPNGNYNATITGGPVTVSAQDHDDLSVLNLTIGPGGALTMNGGYLHITQNSLRNNGSIKVSNAATLFTDSPATITFSGSGTIDLQTSDASIAGTGSPNATLVNQALIQGQGNIGVGESITNEKTINATGGTLTVEPSATSNINKGVMEASIFEWTSGGRNATVRRLLRCLVRSCADQFSSEPPAALERRFPRLLEARTSDNSSRRRPFQASGDLPLRQYEGRGDWL